VDTGLWWRRSPLWLCVTQEDLILIAVARRHYARRVPLKNCAESRYCHETGKLLIAPAEGLEFSRISMSPGDALRVMNLLIAEH
jgi:hypothetical protein